MDHALLNKPLWARITQAIGYEALLIALSTPLLSWISGHSLLSMGGVALLLSLCAMLWNLVYNAGFDALQRKLGRERTPALRLVHALGFELSYAAMMLPLGAWLLGITLKQALMLEIGFFVLLLPYTLLYQWLADHLWLRYRARHLPVTI